MVIVESLVLQLHGGELTGMGVGRFRCFGILANLARLDRCFLVISTWESTKLVATFSEDITGNC